MYKHHSICSDSWVTAEKEAGLDWDDVYAGRAADETHVGVTLRDGKVLPWQQEQRGLKEAGWMAEEKAAEEVTGLPGTQ